MIKRIHVNLNTIRSNAKKTTKKPVLAVRVYKTGKHKNATEVVMGSQVLVNGPCRVVYSPEKPLECGAKVWIETGAPVYVGRRKLL